MPLSLERLALPIEQQVGIIGLCAEMHAVVGRAMQEKERERKTKSGKIIKVAGCSPIREGVLLIKPDTTLEDVADLAKSVNSVGASHRYKSSCTKTRGIGSVESHPQTIRRVFKSAVVGSNPIITPI